MAGTISAEIVTQTWQWMAERPASEAPRFSHQMKVEQPVILVYLLASEAYAFTPNEQELIFYIGLVVWQIMKQGPKRLRKVTRRKLEQAERTNQKLLELLASDSDADFVSATRTMLETYPEPEVLGYVVETLMDEESYDPDDPPIREAYRGLAFVHLKTVVDAFVASLAP